MVVGVITDTQWLRTCSILIAVFVVGHCIEATIRQAAAEVRTDLRKWAHEPFEKGFQAGREAGIAEGFALSNPNPATRHH